MIFLTFLGCAVVVLFGLYVLAVGVTLCFGNAMFTGKFEAWSFIPIALGAFICWLGVHLMPFTITTTVAS